MSALKRFTTRFATAAMLGAAAAAFVPANDAMACENPKPLQVADGQLNLKWGECYTADDFDKLMAYAKITDYVFRANTADINGDWHDRFAVAAFNSPSKNFFIAVKGDKPLGQKSDTVQVLFTGKDLKVDGQSLMKVSTGVDASPLLTFSDVNNREFMFTENGAARVVGNTLYNQGVIFLNQELLPASAKYRPTTLSLNQ